MTTKRRAITIVSVVTKVSEIARLKEGAIRIRRSAHDVDAVAMLLLAEFSMIFSTFLHIKSGRERE